MRFAHLSDTHIKLLKEHSSYRIVFDKIYNTLKEEKVDAIIHCGDLFHTKIQLTPEAIKMASDFLRSLADLAPLYIIPGNHDVNLKNNNRLDSISPIVEALEHKNIHYLKKAGETDLGNGIVLNSMSMLDPDNWVKPTDLSKTNIALFHGSVAGVQTDIGYVMQHGDYSVDIFDGFDYAFLGDIHMTNQILDTEGRVRYCGSTVQQNFGEFDDKGFLLWDIQDKDNFTCKHITIPNPRPFVTLILDSEGNLPDVPVKKSAKIRIVADTNVSLEKVRKAIDIAKSKHQPENVTFVNKAAISKTSADEIRAIGHVENLRDLSVQERLIRDYLKDYKAEEEIVNKVLDLNKKLSLTIEEGEEISRGIHWSLKNLEWNNLFNYGKGNKINFNDLSGIVGIFGKNFSGKSSIVDSLIYTLFNTTSKNNRKNLNVINQNKDNGDSKAVIEINNSLYTVERKSEKYLKKLKGVETLEAKTDVQFTTPDESLNGEARNDTDKNIRRVLGTVEDFFLTSMATQFGYLSFISEGSTKRKEILAKFLDLENFEKKFKLAKDESSELKSLLKKLEGTDYKKDINSAEIQLLKVDAELAAKKALVGALKQKLVAANDTLCELQKCIANIPSFLVDHEDVKIKINGLIADKERMLKENVVLEKEIEKGDLHYTQSNLFLSLINEEELKEKEKTLDSFKEQIRALEKEFSASERELQASDKKIELLKEVPCGDSFPTCKFIRDAFSSKLGYEALKTKYDATKDSLSGLGVQSESLSSEVTKVSEQLSKLKTEKAQMMATTAANELKLEKNKNALITLEKELADLETKLKEYENNKEAIENYEKIILDRDNAKENVKKLTNELSVAEHEVVELYKSQGSLVAKKEIFLKQSDDLEELRKQYAAYDLYLSCMHPSGISYEIIKSKLPEINQEIAKILTNVVDFSIYLENDDDKLDIMIKHPNYDARPLDMGSGAEKTLASTAIRLALLNVTTLPTGDIFILDEPGTALDAENLDGFVRLLDLIKGYFKTVIIISHLDSLKDCVDTQIVIEKKDGFAYVNM